MAATNQICHMLYVRDASYSVYITPGLLSHCPLTMLFIEIVAIQNQEVFFSVRSNNKGFIITYVFK